MQNLLLQLMDLKEADGGGGVVVEGLFGIG